MKFKRRPVIRPLASAPGGLTATSEGERKSAAAAKGSSGSRGPLARQMKLKEPAGGTAHTGAGAAPSYAEMMKT